MTNFVYIPTGKVKIKGCASPTSLEKHYNHKFAIGSTVFVKRTAMRCGKLEKVVVKKVNMVGNVFNYVDTLNEVYLEHELLWESEVVPLAIEYWENILSEVESASGCL